LLETVSLMRKSDKEIFIWTEAFNCGDLLPAFLNSYLMHNDHEINVYAFKSDLEKIANKQP
jgi:hypothetical protein